jgi:hypothetical protein
MTAQRHRKIAIVAGILMLLLAISYGIQARSPHLAQAQSMTITVNGASGGRVFEGVGAISGGGGTSRLLFDYPAQQRSEILDFLFKPNFGASLHIFKVEIGGDENSTNGAEASHQRTPTDQNFQRGYEWFLMEQAKLRNPNIKLAALEWGAPGWFNGGAGGVNSLFSQDNINYIINWIKHAKSDHGLTIDFIGGWNECLCDYSGHKSFYENLKSQLQSNNLATQLIADDSVGGDFNVVNDLANDAAFRNAVDMIGVHYICGPNGDGHPSDVCTTNSTAIGLGKPIWASEHGSQNFDGGATPLARSLNRLYIDAKATAAINWSLISAWYRTLPDFGMGLMLADEPWSGHYQVGKSIWVMAHTAQFAQPGWRYLDTATGFLGGARSNGSFVALKAPNNTDYSLIIETADATAARTVAFNITGGLSTGTVHVWASNLRSNNLGNWFVHQTDITPSSGSFTFTLQPGFLYSISTTTGQAKGAASPPPSAMLALPYSDNFESYPTGSLVKYFAAVAGAFETAPCTGGHTGQCMRQIINRQPIDWPIGSRTPPLVVAGDPGWSNYQVSIDALLEQSGTIDLVGRVNAQFQFGNSGTQGYHLRVTDTGTWTLFREDSSTDTTLASGSHAFGLNTWHNLKLDFSGDAIQAFIDGASLTTVHDASFGAGQIGLLVSKWRNAQFDNFSVTPNGGGNNVTTIDDSIQGAGLNQFNYDGSWQHCSGCGADLFNGTNSWDDVTNDSVTVAFNGTQLRFFGVKDPGHGIGAVSIDGGAETAIDFFAATRAGNQLMFTSPTLAAGNHSFKLRVTGTKNAASTDVFVVPDRVDILSGSTPTNLALNRPATGSTPCNANEGPPKAVNGSVSGGNSDKWCSSVAGTKFLQVDLGSSKTVSRFVVRHAGAGGESTTFNTSAFNLQVSGDGATFTTVVNVTGNTASVTTHNIAATAARFVRLNVVTGAQPGSANTARIYELEVFGP